MKSKLNSNLEMITLPPDESESAETDPAAAPFTNLISKQEVSDHPDSH